MFFICWFFSILIICLKLIFDDLMVWLYYVYWVGLGGDSSGFGGIVEVDENDGEKDDDESCLDSDDEDFDGDEDSVSDSDEEGVVNF